MVGLRVGGRAVAFPLAPLMVSLSNHEPLILRHAQDERGRRAQDERGTALVGLADRC